MSDRKPLVIEDGQVEQLQGTDDLDIPLADRVDRLEARQRALIIWLLGEGFELPSELMEGVN